MQKQEYKSYAEKKSPNSPLALNMLKAFIIGGLICVLGEGVRNFYTNWGLSLEEVAAATSITMVFLGVLLTGIGIYDNIAKHAGAGTLVPITGFANSVASPAIEYKSEGYVLGVGAKMFIIAGPVIVYGTTASVIAGLIYYFIHYFIQ